MRPDVRAIFLSDLHLGLTGCRADLALSFLRATTSEGLYLVGDILDLWVMRRRGRWDPVYNRLVRHVLKRARSLAGAEPWSFSRAVKASVKRATTYISNFEQVLAERARSLGAHGVICGHIHQPVIKSKADVVYLNCGDWIEHCTAIVEDWDGRFALVSWTREADTGADEDDAADVLRTAPGAVR